MRTIKLGWLPPIVGQADANGNATLNSDAPPGACIWQVSRMIVMAGGSLPGQCLVYRGTIDATGLLDGTQTATFDVWEAPEPEVLDSGDQLFFVYSGLSPNVEVRVLVHRRELSVPALVVDDTFSRW